MNIQKWETTVPHLRDSEKHGGTKESKFCLGGGGEMFDMQYQKQLEKQIERGAMPWDALRANDVLLYKKNEQGNY